MSIRVTCPNCFRQFNAPDEFMGKKAKCNGCGEAFVVEETGLEEPNVIEIEIPDDEPESFAGIIPSVSTKEIKRLKSRYESNYKYILAYAFAYRIVGWVVMTIAIVFGGFIVIGMRGSNASIEQILLALIIPMSFAIVAFFLLMTSQYIRGFAVLCASSERSADSNHDLYECMKRIEAHLKSK